MDLLGGYSSDEKDDSSANPKNLKFPSINRNRRALNPTPQPSTLPHLVQIRALVAQRHNAVDVYDANEQPLQGPSEIDPHGPKPQSRGDIGTHESNYDVGEMDFRKQRNLFERTGRALAPQRLQSQLQSQLQKDDDSEEQYVESSEVANQSWYASKLKLANHDNHPSAEYSKKRRRVDTEAEAEAGSSWKKTEPLVHDSDDEETYGIWAPPSKTELALQQDQITQIDLMGGPQNLSEAQQQERSYIQERDRQRGLQDDSNNSDQKFDRMVERKMSHLLPPRMNTENPTPYTATTIFHGSEQFDYKGQSWMAPPPGSSKSYTDHNCYVPKKCIHRFTGHNKGVQRIRLFPKTGHLLLSAGLDHKCKLWSIPLKQVMRTYIGHSAAVRDVTFNNTGTQFVSASYDRFLRLWDTESGKVLNTFTNRRVPYVVQFYPNDNDYIVVGCSDNKVVTYNIHTAEITQEYNHHLAPVNTITFLNDAAQMLTSSDDKKVLLWEWDVGVPIKYISDPTLHSMPAITLHPSHKFWVGQSLDNEIKVYEASGKMSHQRRKKFSGHQVAGYACDLTISPDGRFLASGDGNGKLFFWDWRMHKILQKYHAHDKGPAIACVWHPTIPSTVFTCGWDGVIKMWE